MPSPLPRHIAIVGCGFAGTSALFQLVDRHPVREITVLEASGQFGPGYAYRPDECSDYLINNTTDTMCLLASNRRAFIDWLNGRPEVAASLAPKGHLPRRVYGEFLIDVMRSARTIAAIKGIHLREVGAEVTHMHERADGQVEIGWAGGSTVVDAALLTTGRCPDRAAHPLPPVGAAARYVANHIHNPAFDDIALDATCHVLGASLSAYDAVNRLFSPATGCRFEADGSGELTFIPGPNERHAVLGSRSGRLKKMQSREPMKIQRSCFVAPRFTELARDGALTLAALGRLIQQEAQAHRAQIDWSEVLEPYRGCTDAADVNRRAGALLDADIAAARNGGTRNFLVDLAADAQLLLWDAFTQKLLPAAEERVYRSSFETTLLCYAAPCPIPTAQRLLALHRAGRLQVRRGVGQVTIAEDGSHYRIAHAHGVDQTRVLINTTGSVDRRVNSAGQPALVASLRDAGLLRAYSRDAAELDGADVDMANFRARGSRNIFVANMFLWGPGFFTSSAFMMASIVERLLTAIFEPPGRVEASRLTP